METPLGDESDDDDDDDDHDHHHHQMWKNIIVTWSDHEYKFDPDDGEMKGRLLSSWKVLKANKNSREGKLANIKISEGEIFDLNWCPD